MVPPSNIQGDERWVREYIEHALGKSFDEATKLTMFRDVEQKESLLQTLINVCTANIMASSNLLEACGRFDYVAFIDSAIRLFHNLVGDPNVPEKLMIVAGRTQLGKTSVKGVVQSLCGLLKIPLIVLTKGIDESIELHKKLVKFADGTNVNPNHIVIGKMSSSLSKYYDFM